MSTTYLGGVGIHIPDQRPIDPVHATAWDMIRLPETKLLEELELCSEPGIVRIIGRVMFNNEKVRMAAVRRHKVLMQPRGQLHFPL